MGLFSSSEEISILHHRRLSRYRTTPPAPASIVPDYRNAPIRRHRGVVPTMPSFPLLSKKLPKSQLSKNNASHGHGHSAGCECREGRPSRRSTDALNPPRQVPVLENTEGTVTIGNRCLNNEERAIIGIRYFPSKPESSSSSSTESSRTQSTGSSDTSPNLPLYVPYRRRSWLQYPGLATRPAAVTDKATDSIANRPEPRVIQPYSPPQPVKYDACPPPSVPTQNQIPERLVNTPELFFKQLGSIEFGSLKIMNGSPLSMQSGVRNANAKADHWDTITPAKTVSTAAVGKAPITHIQLKTPHTTIVPDFTPKDRPEAAARAHKHRTMGIRQALKTSKSHNAIKPTQAPEPEPEPATTGTVQSRMPSVIGDEQLKLVRRRRNTRKTDDDASSIYSMAGGDAAIPPDIPQHKRVGSEVAQGSFQSFRNFFRHKKSKSDLKISAKPSQQSSFHRRSKSEQGRGENTRTRSASRGTRKLQKKNPSTAAATMTQLPPLPPPPPPDQAASPARGHVGTPNEHRSQSRGHTVFDDQIISKGQTPSKSDGGIPGHGYNRNILYGIPPIPSRIEQRLQARPTDYEPIADSVSHVPPVLPVPYVAIMPSTPPILSPITRARYIPRVRKSVSLDELPREIQMPTRGRQIRRQPEGYHFKPLPIPKPDLPQRRTPIRVTPLDFDSRHSHLEPPQNKHSVYPIMPWQISPQTESPMDDYGGDDDHEFYMYSQDDRPFVSPLSDEDHEFWLVKARDMSPRRASVPKLRESSPLHHANSLPSRKDAQGRPLRTPAPISSHSRRARGSTARQPLSWTPSHGPQPQHYEESQTYPSRSPSEDNGAGGSVGPEPAVDTFDAAPNDGQYPPVYRHGTRRGGEARSNLWQPPYRILHSYYSPAYRNAPIWG